MKNTAIKQIFVSHEHFRFSEMLLPIQVIGGDAWLIEIEAIELSKVPIGCRHTTLEGIGI